MLANLVGNAIQHTPAGGSVTIEARTTGVEVRVEVCDTGEGIPAADLPHVFERFYRGEKSRSRATGGAGLGLAIAKGIVEAHHGRIWAENVAGRGACFTFAAAHPAVIYLNEPHPVTSRPVSRRSWCRGAGAIVTAGSTSSAELTSPGDWTLDILCRRR